MWGTDRGIEIIMVSNCHSDSAETSFAGGTNSLLMSESPPFHLIGIEEVTSATVETSLAPSS